MNVVTCLREFAQFLTRYSLFSHTFSDYTPYTSYMWEDWCKHERLVLTYVITKKAISGVNKHVLIWSHEWDATT